MKRRPFRRHHIPPKLATSRRLGYAAWRADDAAARLAIPPAPPDPLPGDELQHWTFAGPGWSVDVSLEYIGRHARSDQYRVLIDGREWSPCAGVADALAHIRRDVLPRTASKRQRDEIAREDYRAAAASQASESRVSHSSRSLSYR